MTRRVLENLCTKMVCADFLAAIQRLSDEEFKLSRVLARAQSGTPVQWGQLAKGLDQERDTRPKRKLLGRISCRPLGVIQPDPSA